MMTKRFLWIFASIVLTIVVVYFIPLQSIFIIRTKLSDSDYVNHAYKIVPGNLSEDAKHALNGFTFHTKNLADGSIEAEFIPHERWYKYHKIIVKPGYSLYFLEHDDDSTSTFEKFLNDDHPFLVDPNGYIVE